MKYNDENQEEMLKNEERVTITVLKNSENDIPWEGGINGKFFRIKRGVPVEVPVSLAKLIYRNERVIIESKENVKQFTSGGGKNLSSPNNSKRKCVYDA